MKGRALIDLPELRLACGQYGSIPNDVAASLVKAGSFDPKATFPGQVDDFPKQKGKNSDTGNPDAGGKDGGGEGGTDGDNSTDSPSGEAGGTAATTDDQAK